MIGSQQNLIARITTFLRDIGLEVRSESLPDETFLPGITVKRGALIFDESKLAYPGDLLHEAGHLAVVSPERRKTLNDSVGRVLHEEMCAIAWSFAAVVQLDIAPEILFHAGGYQGGGQSFIQNFSTGHYVAVCTLEWLGLTTEPKKSLPPGTMVYPKMHKWLVD
jgi:hypothetical protein